MEKLSLKEYGRLLDENAKLRRQIDRMDLEIAYKESEVQKLIKILKGYDRGITSNWHW